MKNARYKGGSGTGVDLMLPLVDGQQRPAHVDPGDALPEKYGDVAVDPAFIEQLLEQDSEWEPTVVETAAQRKQREQDEQDEAEQQAAADEAAAEHLAAAKKAAAAAVERVKDEQKKARGKGGTS